MKCALASMGFINKDISYNKRVIMDTMVKYSKDSDIVIFGEAFLQGFEGITFEEEKDSLQAVSLEDSVIQEIFAVAKDYHVAVSFGFIEKEEEKFFSSQLTVDEEGKIIDLFRRVSPGWKEPFAGDRYCEGEGFHFFFFHGKKIVVGLCGDLWFDENISEVAGLQPDVVFWPVYTDYNPKEWNSSIKFEYAKQAGKCCGQVLYVNSLCRDKNTEDTAKGGSAFFCNGEILSEIPSGGEDVLMVEIEG